MRVRWFRWIAPVLAAAALFLPGRVDARPMTPAQIVKKWGDAVVTIVTPNGSGTGFFDDFGFLFTSYRVMDGCDQATIQCPDGTKGNVVSVLYASKDLDLAVLWTDQSGTERGPDCRTAGAVSPGDAFVVIGSPQGQDHTVLTGIISGKRSDGDVALLQLSTSASPDCGGSPVFNDHGDVAGMVVSLRRDGDNLSYAIAGSQLRNGVGVPLSTVFQASSATPPSSGATNANGVTADEATLEALRQGQQDGVVGQALASCPDLAVSVEFDGDNHPGITADDVDQWCSSELSQTASALQLISMSDLKARDKAPWAQTAMTTLDNFDASRRCLHVTITPSTSPSVTLALDRAAITPGGLVCAQPYIDYAAYSVDAGDTASAALEKCVRKLLKTFGDAWTAANKPASEPAKSSRATSPAHRPYAVSMNRPSLAR